MNIFLCVWQIFQGQFDLANKQRTEAQVKVLEITCASTLLCELYVVDSNVTAQVCAVKYVYEYEQCWNAKIQFTAGKFA